MSSDSLTKTFIMTHQKIVGALYFIFGYFGSIALYIESEHVYSKLFAAAIASYLTWHLLENYDDLQEN
jgi:hypothetical protein